MLRQRWGRAPRDRPAGGGLKPPQAASVNSRGGERCGKRRNEIASGEDQEGERKRTADDLSRDLMTSKPGFAHRPGSSPGAACIVARAVSGTEAARAWSRLWHGTWEPVASTLTAVKWTEMVPRSQEGEPQAQKPARGRVPMRGTGTDRPVVALKLGNASRAKGPGHPGSVGGQPQ
jgi:hypothetical protein